MGQRYLSKQEAVSKDCSSEYKTQIRYSADTPKSSTIEISQHFQIEDESLEHPGFAIRRSADRQEPNTIRDDDDLQLSLGSIRQQHEHWFKSAHGDRWSASGRVILACEDNLDFLSSIQDATIMLVVTSPPYNLGKDYESRLTLPEYLKAQEKVIRECVRVLHPLGSLCWQVGNYVNDGEVLPLDSLLFPVFRDQRLKLRNRIIWHFGHGLHATRRLSGRYETINWWTKSDSYKWDLDPIRIAPKYPNKRHYKGPKRGELSSNPNGKNPSDVWEFPNVKSNHPEKTEHPCQFPVELVERLVLSMTEKDDSVLDPYMGVGSSVVAALKNDRIAYGCDIVPKYVNITWQRVRDLDSGELRIRPMGKPIYDPSQPNGGH